MTEKIQSFSKRLSLSILAYGDGLNLDQEFISKVCGSGSNQGDTILISAYALFFVPASPFQDTTQCLFKLANKTVISQGKVGGSVLVFALLKDYRPVRKAKGTQGDPQITQIAQREGGQGRKAGRSADYADYAD